MVFGSPRKTTPEEFRVIFWFIIGLLVFFGTLAIYLGATAPEEKRELGERVMRGGLIAVVTALIMLVGRVVLKRFL